MKGIEFLGGKQPPGRELAQRVDLSLCRADMTAAEVETACRRAQALGVAGVVVNTSRVVQAAHWLEDSPVKVIGAIGFPWGAVDGDTKRFETEVAIDTGAQRIELTVNPGHWKEGNDATLIREWRDVVEAAEERPVLVRFEADWVSMDTLDRLCGLARESNVDGLTLVSPGRELVQALRHRVGERFELKVDLPQPVPEMLAALWEAGASRYGLRELG